MVAPLPVSSASLCTLVRLPMDQNGTNQKVTLGCGTLILIALIVLIFGSAGNNEVKRDLREMRAEFERLERVLQSQNGEIAGLRAAVEKLSRQLESTDDQPEDRSQQSDAANSDSASAPSE